MVYDLEQSNMVEKERSDDNLLLAFQKSFRTAIRIWTQQPFTSSERMRGTKSIVFPFVYSDRRRVLIERNPECERLDKRGINHPLLVYKYSAEDAHRSEEYPDTKWLEDAGIEYLSLQSDIIKHFSSFSVIQTNQEDTALICETTAKVVGDQSFKYLNYDTQFKKLTTAQKKVVESSNNTAPIRIEGPAGTGKTASMLLRAYRLLESHRSSNQAFKVLFIAHSESTKEEIYSNFSLFEHAELYLNPKSKQQIIFTTLFNYCIETLGLDTSQVIEHDATEAKQTQKMLIADAAEKVIKRKYKTYRPLLSENFKKIIDSDTTPRNTLFSLLQHEFSVQIKGRTDGTIEEYSSLVPIRNALPAKTENEKKFVFEIFLEYQKMLYETRVYDNDDITIAALAHWNAPIWRRERTNSGYDYIFVDEMHLFSINEQHAFHYLTKDPIQKQIPICFALDYSQAIGDRGDVTQDYIEKTFGSAERNNYKTVFRSSPQITEFCAAISASGALMFQKDYRNPYDINASGFTLKEERLCTAPELHMYADDKSMIDSLSSHIEKCTKDLQCKNSEIIVISFDDKYLLPEIVQELSKQLNKKILVLKDRDICSKNRVTQIDDTIVFSNPYNVNGLEFKCVILLGVDEGRVPQTIGVSDVSANYIKYSAFNQLYLTSSRAKYRLLLLGNSLHGQSTCLQYAIENNKISVMDVTNPS